MPARQFLPEICNLPGTARSGRDGTVQCVSLRSHIADAIVPDGDKGASAGNERSGCVRRLRRGHSQVKPRSTRPYRIYDPCLGKVSDAFFEEVQAGAG